MKLVGVFFLYWLTGLSSKPILACDQHPGVPHERWLQFVNQVNAQNENKPEPAASAAPAKPEPSRRDRVSRPRATAGESTRSIGR